MSTASASLTLKQAALGDLGAELASTRRVLERLPEEHFTWKPHEKSMSLGALGYHVANLLSWQNAILASDTFDLASAPPPRTTLPESLDEILRVFDENAAAFTRAFDELDDAALAADWTLRHGSHVIHTQPRAMALRNMGISHMIHHRAQLGVYLRLLDVPVPPVYGPTADERR